MQRKMMSVNGNPRERADIEDLVADLFERAGAESFEAGATFAVAEVFSTWVEQGDAPLEAETALQAARKALSVLWEDLSTPTKSAIASRIETAMGEGNDPSALFEEVLHRRGQTVSRAAALTATAHDLNQFLAEIVPSADTILDPACGLGGSLAAVARPNSRVVGFDKNTVAAAIAKLRLMLLGVRDSTVEVADALTQEGLGKFDLVVAHPPQGSVLERWEVTPSVAKQFAEGRLGSVDGDSAWLQFVADHVSKAGFGFVVLPLVFLEERRQPEKVLANLAAEGLLEAIVRLPATERHRPPQVLLVVSGTQDPRKDGKILVMDAREAREGRRVQALATWLHDAAPPEGDIASLATQSQVLGKHLLERLAPEREQVEVHSPLTGLVVKNFKSFGPEKTLVPLKPLTLIFGKNSAGKSSITQALMTLARSVDRGQFDAGEWGGWESLVHGHDHDAEISLGLALGTGDSFVYRFSRASGNGGAPDLDVEVEGDEFSLEGSGPAYLLEGAPFERIGLLAGPPAEDEDPWALEVGEMLVGASEELAAVTHDFVHLGPLRTPPKRYIYGDGSKEAMHLFLAKNPSERHQISLALQKLGVKYEVDVVNPVAERYRAVLGNAVSLVLRDLSTGMEFSAVDVGFGVSQVLPIATELSVRTSSLIAIEQPEIHLHPSMQAAMADLFIESINPDGRANQIIAETHSETLMLRLQRRIREQVLSHEDVLVLYVDKDEDGASKVSELRLDANGDFLDHWPQGFFDDRFNELFGAL